MTVGGNSYDVTTFVGSYSSDSAKFNITDMPWWGNATTAADFSTAVNTSLGLPNGTGGVFGPYFAWRLFFGDVESKAWISFIPGTDDVSPSVTGIRTYAILNTSQPPSTSSVPAPLPLFGAAAAFGWSRRLRSRLGAGHSSGVN